MRSERDKMLAGELYNPLDREARRGSEKKTRNLCQALNATREAKAGRAAATVSAICFGAGSVTVWIAAPFFCDYGSEYPPGGAGFSLALTAHRSRRLSGDNRGLHNVRTGRPGFCNPHLMNAELRRTQEFSNQSRSARTSGSAAGRMLCPGVRIGSRSVMLPAVSSHGMSPTVYSRP